MLAWCPSAKTIVGGVLTILISFGVMTFISSLISNLGNKLQTNLFELWGGAPTTVIMRYSNPILDKYTKERYHKWLSSKINNLDMPSCEKEKTDPKDADQKYRSATNFLREFTRDNKKHSKIYYDNVAYGFARNLLAIRNFGIVIATISVMVNAFFIFSLFQNNVTIDQGILINNLFGIGSGFVSIVFMATFLLIINTSFVKERAFRYAKSLFEACELN